VLSGEKYLIQLHLAVIKSSVACRYFST